jgi:hypothetical protein
MSSQSLIFIADDSFPFTAKRRDGVSYHIGCQWSTTTSIDGKLENCDRLDETRAGMGPRTIFWLMSLPGLDAVLARSWKLLHGADVPARTRRLDERPDLIYDLRA